MTDLRKAAEMALDAMERRNAVNDEYKVYLQDAIETLRQALAQPEQEPVAWQLWVGADTPLDAPMGWTFYSTYDSLRKAETSARTINSYQQSPFAKIVPLYTAPPSKEWVSMTDEEISEVLGGDIHDEPSGELKFIRAIEAALRSKNDPTSN